MNQVANENENTINISCIISFCINVYVTVSQCCCNFTESFEGYAPWPRIGTWLCNPSASKLNFSRSPTAKAPSERRGSSWQIAVQLGTNLQNRKQMSTRRMGKKIPHAKDIADEGASRVLHAALTARARHALQRNK